MQYEAEELSLLEPSYISDALDINGKQTKELICITGGYPEIMREYKQNKSVENTIRNQLEPGSAFCTLAPTIMEQLFPDKIFVFMFTNKTITKACWEMEKQFDNVHFIQEKSLLRGMGLPLE